MRRMRPGEGVPERLIVWSRRLPARPTTSWPVAYR